MRAASRIFWASRLLFVPALCLASSLASAQVLTQPSGGVLTGTLTQLVPVKVTVSGDHADIVLGNQLLPLAEASLDFEDASGLTPSSLGVTAKLLDVLDQNLLSRLPDLGLTQLTGALPLLLTIEPPANGGLSFRNTGRLEIHTHLLPYTVGSSLRVFKAPLLGPFRDVTDEIARGSVRARTTYGGFSQFLILVDLRSTNVVIDEKIGWLRAGVATLPVDERAPFDALLDQTEAAVDAADYTAALTAIDALRSRAQERAGIYIPNEWRSTHDSVNQAGELVAGANTLRFSVAYMRDFGP
jgi:hypothetical protein